MLFPPLIVSQKCLFNFENKITGHNSRLNFLFKAFTPKGGQWTADGWLIDSSSKHHSIHQGQFYDPDLSIDKTQLYNDEDALLRHVQLRAHLHQSFHVHATFR